MAGNSCNPAVNLFTRPIAGTHHFKITVEKEKEGSGVQRIRNKETLDKMDKDGQ